MCMHFFENDTVQATHTAEHFAAADKNMWGTSLDIKSAYHHMPIHPRDKPFLVFEYEGHFFQHESLPFGLAVAPREWQHAMEVIAAHMRARGCLIWIYLDDFLIVGQERKGGAATHAMSG